MKRKNRTFRVFVSSTFSDMKAERNALQEHVYPKLCERNGCWFLSKKAEWRRKFFSVKVI